MGNPQGFWSYVHADDEAEGNRISRLARDVASQFELLTGEPPPCFSIGMRSSGVKTGAPRSIRALRQ
jgi:hypothetical protein